MYKYIQKTFICLIGFIMLGMMIHFVYGEPIQLNRSVEEGMENHIIMKKHDAFCEHHREKSGVLEKSCGKLTEKNCNTTSCCVWASPGKCVAGGPKGPTFQSADKNSKTNNVDYYYYQNKCYGEKCPK